MFLFHIRCLEVHPNAQVVFSTSSAPRFVFVTSPNSYLKGSGVVMLDELMVDLGLPSEAILPESKDRSYYADLSMTP